MARTISSNGPRRAKAFVVQVRIGSNWLLGAGRFTCRENLSKLFGDTQLLLADPRRREEEEDLIVVGEEDLDLADDDPGWCSGS